MPQPAEETACTVVSGNPTLVALLHYIMDHITNTVPHNRCTYLQFWWLIIICYTCYIWMACHHST